MLIVENDIFLADCYLSCVDGTWMVEDGGEGIYFPAATFRSNSLSTTRILFREMQATSSELGPSCEKAK